MAWLSSRARAPWRGLHRWLGLVLGPLFVLLGLSGSLLVWYTEIDAAIEPALRVPVPVVQGWQPVLDALNAAHPARDRGWRIELPPGGRGVVTARYLKPAETAGEFFAPLLVSVNPASGEVLASRWWGRFAATWLFDLHYTLLLGEPGLTAVGVAGLLLALVIVAGTLLWWPRRGHWGAALRLKWDASVQRRHYDLHKAFALGGGLVLLVLALTGAALALPSFVEPAVQALSPLRPLPRPPLARVPGTPLLPLDALLAAAQRHWPDAVPRWVDTPAAGSALVRVRLWRPGEPSRRFPRSYLWLDAQRGTVLAEHDARSGGAGEGLLAWLHPLHNGEAFGTAGRVLATLGGLVPLGLALTGWWRWRDRRRAQRRR